MSTEYGIIGQVSSLQTLLKPLCMLFLLLGILSLGACRRSSPSAAPNEPVEQLEPVKPVEPAKPAAPVEPNVSSQAPPKTSLFDGKTLGQWQITDFGGQGDVYVKDGAIYLEVGNDMTGVTWGGPLLKANYEITLDAMRVSGSDFFCGLTFPVGESCCSLVLGGWGGTVCGLSNIDYYDAANNETTRIVSFENGKWYHVRLRVRPNRITAWLDEEAEPLVDVDITDRKIDTRIEMDLCQPMGIATWQTSGAIRNICVEKLDEEP